MKITIFSKTRKTQEGRTFKVFLSKLVRKSTGEELTVSVKFPAGTPEPEKTPCIIELAKGDCNLSERLGIDRNGAEVVYHTLWVKRWTPSSEVWRDTSMDDIAD